jgi:plasmid stability protein
MATIQIRNIPETVHRVYRTRAAAAGMSLQEYLLREIVEGAALRTPDEVVSQVADAMRDEGSGGYSAVRSALVVRADRVSH